MWSVMLNYVIYQHYCHYIDVIALEWYLISFLMIIIVFLFCYRGESEPDNGNDSENVRWNKNECEHVGSVDSVDTDIWCDVFYHVVHMTIYCNIINVIKKRDSLFNFIIPCATTPTQWHGIYIRPIANLAQPNVWSTSEYLRHSVIAILCNRCKEWLG